MNYTNNIDKYYIHAHYNAVNENESNRNKIIWLLLLTGILLAGLFFLYKSNQLPSVFNGFGKSDVVTSEMEKRPFSNVEPVVTPKEATPATQTATVKAETAPTTTTKRGEKTSNVPMEKLSVVESQKLSNSKRDSILSSKSESSITKKAEAKSTSSKESVTAKKEVTAVKESVVKKEVLAKGSSAKEAVLKKASLPATTGTAVAHAQPDALVSTKALSKATDAKSSSALEKVTKVDSSKTAPTLSEKAKSLVVEEIERRKRSMPAIASNTSGKLKSMEVLTGTVATTAITTTKAAATNSVTSKVATGSDVNSSTTSAKIGQKELPKELFHLYVVSKGETIYSIALKEYKDRGMCKKIIKANPDLMNPNNIHEGQELLLPIVDESKSYSHILHFK